MIKVILYFCHLISITQICIFNGIIVNFNNLIDLIMNNILLILLVGFFSLTIISYAAPKKSAAVWVNKEKIVGKTYKIIFVIAQTQNVNARQIVEYDIAKKVTEIGYKVVKSIDVTPPVFNGGKQPTKEEVLEKVKSAGCDGIFLVTLARKEENLKYTPRTEVYAPSKFTSWSGNFFGFYSNYSSVTITSGYYDKEKEYFLQSNFYDTQSSDLLFSVQSSVYNPVSLEKFSKS